jgi:FkbM family methyltransferase
VTLFSCLCVTENRPLFADWVLWNFEKQDYGERELVVVDSSAGSSPYEALPNVRVIRAPPGTSVPAKRNLALRESGGDFVTWFDDDDWQHPRKLSLLADALQRRAIAGSRRSWFVDLRTSAAVPFVLGQGLLFNSGGFQRTVIQEMMFDEGRAKASDTPWMLAVRRRARGSEALLDTPLHFWLCHDRNLSNPSGRRTMPTRVHEVRAALGDAWGDTDERLAALRAPKRAARPRICVAITTYDRPELLDRLLDDLEREAPPEGLDVRVFDDASPGGYDRIVERLRARGWSYTIAAKRHGKHGWWQWWNAILADLRKSPAQTYVVLQDDMRLCHGFFTRALSLWGSIADQRKASLFLHVDEGIDKPRWTLVRQRRVGDVSECGWVDLTAFVCERTMFDALSWRIEPVSATRWRSDPLLGSGVGAQLSVRLQRRRLAMYRTNDSLTLHSEVESRMNPDARRRHPMRTVRFVDGTKAGHRLARAHTQVTATLASIPSRVRPLESVVASLLPQVDELRVYLNGYASVPAFLEQERIVVARSGEHGDRGDAGKFFWAGQLEGYHLLCDDDIRYPQDYVRELVAGIERHGRRAVVGFHGATLREQMVDYYRSRKLLHFSQALTVDTPVHVLGTGLAGYYTSAITVRPEDFLAPNMADVWFALLGQRQEVPFLCLHRGAGWLAELPGCRADSIYVRADGREPTRVARTNGRWRLHSGAPPALVRVPVTGPTRRAVLALPDADHITHAVQRSGTYYERDLLEAIAKRRPRGTFVDVGAHYGNHTVFFALECGAEHIVAVEPNPPAFRGLLENIRQNEIGAVAQAVPAAVHPTLTHVEVVALPWRPRPGSGVTSNSGTVGVRAAPRGGVRAAPLDELLGDAEPVGLVKVDAEGLGAEILASGIGTIERDRPLIAVECATDEVLERVRRLLVPLGYGTIGRYCWTPTWLWAAD